jgi:hypothetical protein
MADALYVRNAEEERIQVDAAVAVGEVWQLPDGRAAVFVRKAGSVGDVAASTNDYGDFRTLGEYDLPLTSSITILDGGKVFWDHSANLCHFRKVNDRDFYVGRAVGDSASNTIRVELNVDPPPDIDLLRNAVLSVPVGTQAVGGFGFTKVLGGAHSLELTATNEAQKIDMLSVDGFAKGANAIVTIILRIADDGAGTAADFNVGVANGTNATDADLITESVFFHFNANSTTIYAESDDGTTEVTATDTTTTYTEGSAVANRKEFWIDMRNPADVQMYVDGVNVLPATVFNVDAATGPLFLLAHLEKTAAADVYRAILDRFDCRFGEQ